MSSFYKSALGDFDLDESSAIICLVRKPYGKNPEHTFLIVESLNSFERVGFFRYDFVINLENPKEGIR